MVERRLVLAPLVLLAGDEGSGGLAEPTAGGVAAAVAWVCSVFSAPSSAPFAAAFP